MTCAGCGVGLTLPEPSRDIASAGLFEEQYGGQRLAARPQWLKEAVVRLDWVQRYIRSGLLLDVGCATGELPFAAAQRDFEAVGAEPSAWAADEARKLGIEVVAEIEDWHRAQPERPVDALTLFHVLEHVHAPRTLLRTIATLMDPAGVLFIEVPNYSSSDARRDPVAWTGPAIEDHVVHYTPNALARLLTEVGYEVLEVTPLPTVVYDTPEMWSWRCRRWLAEGAIAPSENLLRVAATPRGG